MLRKGLLLAAIILIADQLSKEFVFALLDQKQGAIVLLPFLNLVKVWNPGISFGLLNNLAYGDIILTGVTATITLILIIWLTRAHYAPLVYGLGAVIGGAVGNIIDRIRFGAVADFLDFHLYGYHWPAFNIADAAIFCGAIMLCFGSFREDMLQRKKENLNKNGK